MRKYKTFVPKKPICKRLVARIENIIGGMGSLIEIKSYRDDEDFASVTATIETVIPSLGQFVAGANFKNVSEYFICTDGFGILVQRCDKESMTQTALCSDANFLMAELNNPFWKARVEGTFRGKL